MIRLKNVFHGALTLSALLGILAGTSYCGTSPSTQARLRQAAVNAGQKAAREAAPRIQQSLAEQAATQGGAAVNPQVQAQQPSRAQIQAAREQETRRKIQRVQQMNNVPQMRQEMARMIQENARLRAQAETNTAGQPDLRLEYGYLRTRLGYLIARGDVRLFLAKDRVVVAFNTENMFPSGSSKLTRKGRDLVARVTEVLSGFHRKRFRIEGHTDARKSRRTSNWDLAYRRAATVMKLMQKRGITSDRLSAITFGDTRPIDTNTDPLGRAANRRVEISVLDEDFRPDYDYGGARNWRYDDPRSAAKRNRDTYIPKQQPPHGYYDRRNYRERYSRDPLYNDFERYQREQTQGGQRAPTGPPRQGR